MGDPSGSRRVPYVDLSLEHKAHGWQWYVGGTHWLCSRCGVEYSYFDPDLPRYARDTTEDQPA